MSGSAEEVSDLSPDIDTALGVVAGDLVRFHNNVSHSLIFGLVVALVVGGAAGIMCRRSFGNLLNGLYP